MSCYGVSRMDVAYSIWFKWTCCCSSTACRSKLIFQWSEYCFSANFFQFRGIKTDSLHSFSVCHSMAYNEWILHIIFGLNGGVAERISCDAQIWYFKRLNFAPVQSFSKSMVSRLIRYILFLYVILWCIKNVGCIQYFV